MEKANPQIENGYTKIANEFVDKFCRYRISGEEWLVLWVILRKTYGWNKPHDRISLSQFSELTGLDRRIVHRALHKLSSKKMIGVIKKDDSLIVSYYLTKNYKDWVVSSKKMTVIKKDDKGVINIDERVSSKKIPTKDTITKDNIQKKGDFPHFLDEPFTKAWEAFLDMRKTKKKPATEHAQMLILKNLHKYSLNIASQMLENAIRNSWTDVYPLKETIQSATDIILERKE